MALMMSVLNESIIISGKTSMSLSIGLPKGICPKGKSRGSSFKQSTNKLIKWIPESGTKRHKELDPNVIR